RDPRTSTAGWGGRRARVQSAQARPLLAAAGSEAQRRRDVRRGGGAAYGREGHAHVGGGGGGVGEGGGEAEGSGGGGVGSGGGGVAELAADEDDLRPCAIMRLAKDVPAVVQDGLTVGAVEAGAFDRLVEAAVLDAAPVERLCRYCWRTRERRACPHLALV